MPIRRWRVARKLLATWCILLALSTSAYASLELLESAFRGDAARVQQLLDRGASPNYRDPQGSTALMLAASSGHAAVVRALLGRGAQVDARNNYGWTPLMLAIASRQREVARLLLERGADPALRNDRGDTALSLAQAAGLEDLLTSRVTAAPPRTTTPPPAPPRSAEPMPEPMPEPPARVAAPAPPPTRPTAPAASTREQEIARLFREAEEHVRALRLTEPADRNALEVYRRLESMDADGARVEAGLAAIASRYGGLALQRQRAGDLAKAREYVSKGLSVVPEEASLLALGRTLDDEIEAQAERKRSEEVLAALLEEARAKEAQGLLQEGLDTIESALQRAPRDRNALALRDRIRGALARREREAKIAELLAEAKRQEQAGALTSPAGANAAQTYREVLRLDSTHSAATQGLAELVTRLRDRAAAALEGGDLEQAQAAARAALEAAPDDPASQALEARAREAIAGAAGREQALANLATAGRQQIAAGKLIAPAGDNVMETLRQMLAHDPDDRRVAEVRSSAVRALGSRALVQRARGQLEESRESIRAGLELQPGDEDLLAFEADLRALIEHETAQRTAEAERRRAAEQHLTAARELQQSGQLEAALAEARKGAEQAPEDTELAALAKQLQGELEERRRRLDQASALHAEARELSARGQLEEAVAKTRQALTLEPDNAAMSELLQSLTTQVAEKERVQRQLAGLLARAQQQLEALRLTIPAGDNAYDTLRQARQLDPENPQVQAGFGEIAHRYHELAQASLADDSLEDASDYVRRGLEIDSERDELMALAGDIETRKQAIAEAERRAEIVAERLRQARQLMAAGELEQAAAAVAVGLEASAEAPELLALRGELEARMAEQQQLAEERAKRRQDAGELLQQARGQRESGEPEKALADTHRALELVADDPQSSELRTELGQLRQALQGELAAAEERRRELAALLAEAESKQDGGDLEAAMAAVEQALALAPEEAPAQSLQTELERQLEERRQRLAEAELAALLAEAESKQDAGDLEAAMAAVEQALALAPEEASAQSLQTELERQLEERRQRLAEAERRKAQVAGLLSDAESRLSIAKLVEQDGNDALSAYRQVLELDPQNREASEGLERLRLRLLRLAQSYEHDGEDDQALAFADKGLKVAPNNTELETLHSRVAKRLEARRQAEQQAAELLAEARQRRASDDLQGALDKVGEGLALVPGHQELSALGSELRAGIEEREQRRQQAEALYEEAQRTLSAGDYPAATTALEEALKLAPAEPRIVALQRRLEQRLALEKAQQEERARRLDQARALLERRLEIHAQVLATVEQEERSLREATQQALAQGWTAKPAP